MLGTDNIPPDELNFVDVIFGTFCSINYHIIGLRFLFQFADLQLPNESNSNEEEEGE